MATETRQQRRRRERIQRERQRRQKVKVASSATTIPSPKGEHPSIRAWHIALGIPAAFVATGIGLAATGATYFWIGSYLAYVGIAWLLVDWWLFSKTLVMQTRLLGTTGTLIIAGIVTWMSFRPATLTILSISDDVNYADGTEIYGIKWSNRYSELRTVISNDSSTQYHDLEIFIRTDDAIRATSSSSGDQCKYSPFLPGVLIADPTITSTDQHGNKETIPVTLNAGTVFRVYCDKLLANQTIEIVSAIIPNPGNSAPRMKPLWALVKATFVAFGRPETRISSHCFVGTCSHIPASIDSPGANIFQSNPL